MSESPFTPEQEVRIGEIVREALDSVATDLIDQLGREAGETLRHLARRRRYDAEDRADARAAKTGAASPPPSRS